MSKILKDASTSPTIPMVNEPFYCTVTCCNNNHCKPSTILKGATNPYYCPHREFGTYGVSNSCSFSGIVGTTPQSTIPSNYLAVEQFYISGHGCFRRAVPTMPLILSLLLALLNLLLPGSGTFLASIAILFGCNTEYGEKHWFKSFFICLLSAVLQTLTAIFVFGWVWSIMWGIVFIKNSLRYGSKRDIYTISLC